MLLALFDGADLPMPIEAIQGKLAEKENERAKLQAEIAALRRHDAEQAVLLSYQQAVAQKVRAEGVDLLTLPYGAWRECLEDMGIAVVAASPGRRGMVPDWKLTLT